MGFKSPILLTKKEPNSNFFNIEKESGVSLHVAWNKVEKNKNEEWQNHHYVQFIGMEETKNWERIHG